MVRQMKGKPRGLFFSFKQAYWRATPHRYKRPCYAACCAAAELIERALSSIGSLYIFRARLICHTPQQLVQQRSLKYFTAGAFRGRLRWK